MNIFFSFLRITLTNRTISTLKFFNLLTIVFFFQFFLCILLIYLYLINLKFLSWWWSLKQPNYLSIYLEGEDGDNSTIRARTTRKPSLVVERRPAVRPCTNRASPHAYTCELVGPSCCHCHQLSFLVGSTPIVLPMGS